MTTQAARETDPYLLTPEGIKDPPRGWRSSVRYLGPGLILSASIVGSGELIATTALGAEVGFIILWMVVVSTLVKVGVQVELARWAISTGRTALTGYNRVPPRFGRIGWVNALWVVLFLSKIIQTGGIVGGVAIAFSLLRPIGGPPLSFTSLSIWTLFVVIISIALLFSNRYGLLQGGAGLLVALFTFFTVAIAVFLPFSPFPYDGGDLARGFTFRIPAGAVGAAVAMFGITGVGADEITEYPYWCVEKGYARWVGPVDDSEAWLRRANGWIRVMYKDAIVSWVIYTIGTLAFFIMGAAVLHPQGLAPQGNKMLTTLSNMYTAALGDWATTVFLIGAIAVLGSTLWAAIPSWARMCTEFLSTTGAVNWRDNTNRVRWIRGFTVALPIAFGAVYLVINAPVIMVQIGGVMTGIFLVAVVIAVWYLRRTETDSRLYGGRIFHIALVISSIAIGLLGIYSVLNVFGLSIG
ncbi:MAG: Nramp family divalent metal transporter [Nocardioidaceae bacterium]